MTSKRVIICLPDVTTSTMKSLLTFIYTGEVSVGEENLEDLIQAAEMLEIKGLTNGGKDEDEAENKVTVSPQGINKTPEKSEGKINVRTDTALVLIFNRLM